MLKYINIYDLISDGKITEEMGDKIENSPDHVMFNADSDNELIVFRSEAQPKLEEKLGIDLSGADDISLYINSYDGGEVYKLHGRQISIAECIDLLLDEIEQHETEIIESNDFSNTIRILIKQQIPKVIENEIKNLNETISAMKKDIGNDYSNIEWQ